MTVMTPPANAEDFADALSGSKGLAEFAKMSETERRSYLTDYNENVNKLDPGISQQIKAEAEATRAAFEAYQIEMAKMAGDTNARITQLDLSTPDPRDSLRKSVYNRKAPGGRIDDAKIMDDFYDFFGSIWHGNSSADARKKREKLTEIKDALGSVVPSDGGFLIPETLRSTLLQVALETGVVRPRATVVPMETLRVPFPSIDSTSNATNVFGGVTAYWTEESATLTASQPTFGRVVLDAKKLTAYCEVPNELLRDSLVSMEPLINGIFPKALAWFEDVAFLSGTGAGEPLGVLNSGNAALVSVAKETGQAATTIVLENIVKMYSRLLPASMGSAVWVAHPNTFPELATMALSVGTGGSAVWLTNAADGPPMTILGRPVIFSEKVSSLGTAGDIALVDFGYYLIGDRQSMTAESSEHYKFANDQNAFRFIQRVDGKPWLQSAITPKSGTTTLSPYVQIATR